MKGDKGSVLMEYVVLTCFVSLVTLTFLRTYFYNVEKGYVGFGLEWARSIQLLHRAIAAPFP